MPAPGASHAHELRLQHAQLLLVLAARLPLQPRDAPYLALAPFFQSLSSQRSFQDVLRQLNRRSRLQLRESQIPAGFGFH